MTFIATAYQDNRRPRKSVIFRGCGFSKPERQRSSSRRSRSPTSLPSHACRRRTDGIWDIQDTSPWAQDSGGIATGGRANPFNGFGYLKLQVRRAKHGARDNQYLKGFGLASRRTRAIRLDDASARRRHSRVACDVTTSKDTQYLRYFDTFTNSANEERRAGRVGRSGRRLRRWRTGRGGDDVKR